MTGLIERSKNRYGVVEGSLEDRSIDDMLTRESIRTVNRKIKEYYEEGGAEEFNEAMKETAQIIEDHKTLTPEAFREKWM